jgi:RHS repeat-associated protein
MKSKILNLFAFLALLLAGHAQAAQSVTFYHHDALGSVIAKSDSDGYLYLNEEYQPFGEKIYATEDFFGGSDDWYTGKNYSEELDLTYFGARWYDAKQGRFLSIDPAQVEFPNTHSFNRYSYSYNNPYKYTDPDGNSPELIFISDPQAYMEHFMAPQLGVDASTRGGSEIIRQHMGREAAVEIITLGIIRGLGKIAGSLSSLRSTKTLSKGAKEGIYEFPDSVNSNKPYVGQSSNIPSRLKQHERSGRLTPGTEKSTEVLGGKNVREVAEHRRIQEITGGVPAGKSPDVSNKVNPIGPNRHHLLE